MMCYNISTIIITKVATVEIPQLLHLCVTEEESTLEPGPLCSSSSPFVPGRPSSWQG